MTVIHPKRKLSDINEIGIQYNCDGCRANITKVIRIQCAECRDIDLCVECVAEGIEYIGLNKEHRKDHPYCVIEPFSFPVLTPDWRADEELLLIEGLATVGLGNWVDVAEYIGTKTPLECEEHYKFVYLESNEFPLPKSNLVITEKKTLDIPKERKLRFKDGPLEILASHPAVHEIQGYMPKRKEFEQEYENDAEAIIKDISFNENDSSLEIDTKVSLLEYYNQILDKRQERKKFAFNHDFLNDFKKILAQDKARSKEEKDLFQKCQLFGRFMLKEDFDLFVEGILEEDRLKRRISVLQEYRRQGIRDFETAKAYEKELLANAAATPLSSSQTGTPSLRRPLSAISEDPGKGSEKEPLTVVSPASGPVNIPQARTPAVRRPAGVPLDISDADGLELLSASERNLCSVLRILPKLYLNIKETLIAAYYKHGFLKRAQARSLIKIDVNKTSRIYDYFVNAGWILPRKLNEEKETLKEVEEI